MKGVPVEEIADFTGGNLLCSGLETGYEVTQIATDSRTLLQTEHTLFFALAGRGRDGHQFVEELADRGVRVFVVREDFRLQGKTGFALIRTADPLEALQRLAVCHRARFRLPVIAITGSNGKTIVKEWLYELLCDRFSVVRSPKSYNSQIGVPLSVWNLRPEHTLGIFEAGISRPGEMERLESILQPGIGVLTHIGDAHQENFSSLRQKIGEKLRLFVRCRKLVYCMDDPETGPLVDSFCRENAVMPLAWSTVDPEAPLYFSLSPGVGGSCISARGRQLSCSFFIPFTDVSSVENACHCFAALVALELEPGEFAHRFEKLAPLSMRLELKKGVNGCLLLNDCYNSDIHSLEVALSVLMRQADAENLEKVAILSDIQQSGYRDRELYSRVNLLLERAGVRRLIGVGRNISGSASLFSMECRFFETTAAFLREVRTMRFTGAALLIKGARDFRLEEVSALLQRQAHQTLLEINLNALAENLNLFRSLLSPTTRIMVMVKAFSYGSGDVEIARLLQFQRVDYLAVAVTDEGRELREAGITLPVVVMNPEPHTFQQMVEYRLEPNLHSVELLGVFAALVRHNALASYPVHLKVDTGMNRLGVKSDREVTAVAELLAGNPQLKVRSVFSHLAASEDSRLDGFTHAQARRFLEVSGRLAGALGYPVLRHLLNSAGIERFPDYQFEMVRLGIGLYGVSCTGLPLKNAGTLKSIISHVREVAPGESVGYNRAGIITAPSRIAVIPLGYADGLDRRLGNRAGKVFINGSCVQIIGNICMDICMADVTGIDCKPGDEALFIGDPIPIAEVSAAAGTIPYEILTGISHRVKRVYIQE